MVPWNIIASAVTGFFGGFIGSKVLQDEPVQQIGVEDHPALGPIIEIINSTNTRVESLASLHNDHKVQVQQYLVMGLGLLLIIICIVIISIIISCCRRRRTNEKNLRPAFGDPAMITVASTK